MKIRFQADADIDADIRKGLLRTEPAIDFKAAGTIPDGLSEPDVLRIAAQDGLVHFRGFAETQESPGVLLIPSSRSVGAAIEGLLFVWLNRTPGDLRTEFNGYHRQIAN